VSHDETYHTLYKQIADVMNETSIVFSENIVEIAKSRMDEGRGDLYYYFRCVVSNRENQHGVIKTFNVFSRSGLGTSVI
jgi:hypothetical protein